MKTNPHYRTTAHIPSAPMVPFNAKAESRQSPKQYTGSPKDGGPIGLLTMHKSNIVPVTEACGSNPKITG